MVLTVLHYTLRFLVRSGGSGHLHHALDLPVITDYWSTGNKCWGVFGLEKPAPWKEAMLNCRKYGPLYDLASIQDAKEQGNVNPF